MLTAEFDFQLPPELIAQHPAPQRDASRLMVLDRAGRGLVHRAFRDLRDYLRPGDLLILNDSKVIPARLRAMNPTTGGAFEILLLEENEQNDWWAMMRPAKRARAGTELTLLGLKGESTSIHATVLQTNAEGHRRLRFTAPCDIAEHLDALGEMPLPPYIKRAPREQSPEDHSRYQTVFAHYKGSVAAPTAGLHFTQALLSSLRAAGVEIRHVTLHVGLGTFSPVKAQRMEDHVMHEERYNVPGDTAAAIAKARKESRRVIAVGTTCVRVLESVAEKNSGQIVPGPGRTRIFITPPFNFQVVDALITNFHLPQSTLLMLVSAFAAPGEMRGRERILQAYAEAVREQYRFFSYGDAMLIL